MSVTNNWDIIKLIISKGGWIMANIVGTVRVTCKKVLESSSSYAKNGISAFNGRSASIFRISTDYSIKSMILHL